MTDKHSNFIKQLFDVISSDPEIPAELKISLLRLQIPVHNICSNDPSFISNARHPVRRTFFIVKKISSTIKADPALIKKVELILSELLRPTSSTTHFSQTNQRLESLAHTIESSQLAHDSGKVDSADELKRSLNHKIKLCLQQQIIPASCKNLLLKLWPSTLFYIIKTHGEHSSQWVNAIDMYNELIVAIQPVQNIEQLRQIKDHFMSIVRSNNNMLLLYHDNDRVEDAIKHLISHFNQMLGKSQSHSEAQANTADKTEYTAMEKVSSLPSNIKPGIWCEIYIDDITPARRLRLSVININTGTLIFVNRKGIKKVEKDALVFSEELKKGLSRVYKHDALFSKPVVSSKYRKIG